MGGKPRFKLTPRAQAQFEAAERYGQVELWASKDPDYNDRIDLFSSKPRFSNNRYWGSHCGVVVDSKENFYDLFKKVTDDKPRRVRITVEILD